MKRKFFVSLVLMLVVVFTCSLAAVAEEKKADANKEKASTEKKDETAKASAEIALVDVNSASLEELMALPGIGEKIGQSIIDGRPYEAVEDLLEVDRIGEKTLEKIEDLVEVKPVEKDTKKKTEEKPKDDSKKDEKASDEKTKK